MSNLNWEVFDVYDEDRGYPIIDNGGNHIADVADEQDAYLMAASLEMFRALMIAVQITDNPTFKKIARDAISKAKGHFSDDDSDEYIQRILE